MTDSTLCLCVFGQESSNKWWNIEEKGFAFESIAQKHGLDMMSNVGVLGFAIFESNDYSWRPCFTSSLLPKEHSMDMMEGMDFLFAILKKLFLLKHDNLILGNQKNMCQ